MASHTIANEISSTDQFVIGLENLIKSSEWSAMNYLTMQILL